MKVNRWQQMLSIVALTGVTAGLPLLAGSAPATARTLTHARSARTAAPVRAARTSAGEAHRVDGVAAPRLGWYRCYDYAECATANLPQDYDQPHGATVEVALLRVRARDRKHRIGSLFVNPGGPGASGTELAYAAPQIFSPGILQHFDVVGLDPRGTNSSQRVACFPSARQQGPVLDDLSSVAFPVTGSEEQRVIRGAAALGRACSSSGRPLSASMSTAEVARDLDVLRRSVGDKKLSYLGFSYGSYLGEVYASMFPDRFRTLAIDGVLDPVAWAGTPGTAGQPVTDRIRSADGAAKALHELLVRCDRAGGSRCSFAAGDPVANFDVIARRLQAKPVADIDPDTGEEFRFGYADLISAVLSSLYDPEGYGDIEDNLTSLWIATEPPAKRSGVRRRAAVHRLRVNVQRAHRRLAQARTPRTRRFGFPYDNSFEAFATVLCSDSVPARVSSWPAAAAAADRRARYFGRPQVWSAAPCASSTWRAVDEDAYRGSFRTRTAAPVLVVGSRWDPATNYAGAVSTAALLPNSRLLSSDNWGHTAYGTSDCATEATDRYLLTVRLPSRGKKCVGDVQPFVDNGRLSASPLQKLLRPTGELAAARR